MNTKIILGILPLLALLITGCGDDTQNDVALETRAAAAEAMSNPNASQPPAGDLCIAHQAPANRCFICDPSLREPGRLWCNEHSRYEDRCWLCHPELRDDSRLYCEEHGLYEDECFICHPESTAEQSSAHAHDTDSRVASDGSTGLYCNEHDVPEAECGICRPGLADTLSPGQGLKIRLPSVSSEAKAQIVAAHPESGSASSRLHAVGELRFNLNRLAHITPLTEGVVRRVLVDLGQEVSTGQVLAELTSPQIADAKAALLKAVAEDKVSAEALARARNLHGKDAISAREYYDAEARQATARANLRAAEQFLLDLGFDRQALGQIVSQQETESVLPLLAPFAGTVIARHAVVGELVSLGDQMFSVTDLTTLWLNLAVSDRDVVDLRVGQPVALSSPAFDREITGQITWISSQVNEQTRMVDVRAEVANPDGALRAGMFVDATIFAGETASSLLVPRDAVHRFGGRSFVFVRIAGDLYEVRRVDTRKGPEDLTAVTAGLDRSELVAVEQSYLLKSEFQKSRLGAGCVD